VEVGGLGGRAIQLRIVGTATFPTIGDTFAEHASMGTGALFSSVVLPPSVLDAAGPYSGPNAIFIRLRRGTNPATGRPSLEAVDRQLVAVAHSRQVVSLIGSADAAVFTIALLPAQRPAEIVNYRSMGTTPLVLAIGLGVGTLVALGMTLVTSVRRRRYDLALLKTFGFTRGQLFSSVIWQASTILIIGIVVGVPLGIVFGRSLWILFAHQLSAVPQPTVPAGSIALAVAAALVLANLVAAIPGQIAARNPVASVLAND
jgi:putative ABC transport system permease protein